MAAIFTQAYKNIGYEIEIVKMPAKHLLYKGNKSGGVDGVPGRAAITEQVLTGFIRIPMPIVTVEVYYYLLKPFSIKFLN